MHRFVNRLSAKCWPGRSKLPCLCLTLICGSSLTATASTLCVNTKGSAGCYSTISSAVAAAHLGDVVKVANGTYAEDVLVNKSVSIVGEDKEKTIIEAKGLSNGIYIDGLDYPHVGEIVIAGLTIEHANYEGILIQNAWAVTIANNIVHHNDLSLDPSTPACPNNPAFETNEASDCGEGIHLMGVDHSIIAGNIVHDNSGGILTTDETASSHDNLITRNDVYDNNYACGITLASHAGYVKTGTAPLAFGIYHITISENNSHHNGFGTVEGGAGVGLFAPGPGNITKDNSVVHNRLVGNSLPGVAIHNHVNLTFPHHPPNPDVSNNTISGNYISGNGSDGALPTTSPTGISILGLTPIFGTVIAGNVIEDEDIAVAMNSASGLDLHLNDFEGKKVGVDNINTAGAIWATENYWGCAAGPGATGCSTVEGGSSVVSAPWVEKHINED